MKKFFTFLFAAIIAASVCSCSNDGKLEAAVSQAAASLPRNLDEDGITEWTSIAYDKEANIVTFVYSYNPEYVTEEQFAASEADMKAALMNYMRGDQQFIKAMADTKPTIRYELKLKGKDSKAVVEFPFTEL